MQQRGEEEKRHPEMGDEKEGKTVAFLVARGTKTKAVNSAEGDSWPLWFQPLSNSNKLLELWSAHFKLFGFSFFRFACVTRIPVVRLSVRTHSSSVIAGCPSLSYDVLHFIHGQLP